MKSFEIVYESQLKELADTITAMDVLGIPTDEESYIVTTGSGSGVIHVYLLQGNGSDTHDSNRRRNGEERLTLLKMINDANPSSKVLGIKAIESTSSNESVIYLISAE